MNSGKWNTDSHSHQNCRVDWELIIGPDIIDLTTQHKRSII